jgi:excisionase family DNA binding protein
MPKNEKFIKRMNKKDRESIKRSTRIYTVKKIRPYGSVFMINSKSQKPMGVTEAAEFTGLSKAYIYKLVHLGKMPCYKPWGGRVFFKQAELEQFTFRGRKSADYELLEEADRLLAGGAK